MSNNTILVTGAAGFIGARFVEFCNSQNISVISVDHTDHFRSRDEHGNLNFGKIIDRENLFDWLENEGPTLLAIVHLGACSKTTVFDEEFLRRVNVEYSQKIWNYAAQNKIKLVYASSAATYGDGSSGYEDDENKMSKLVPLNPYGRSKQIFDLWALNEEKKGNHPPFWSGFKFFNVYGFGEYHKQGQSSVVFQAFNQIRKNGFLKLFKSHRDGILDGEQKRDFIYVADVVSVMDYAINKPIKRGIFNLGTAKARTFIDLAKATFASMGRPADIKFIDTPVEIRDKYQYFTQASMGKLRTTGYEKPYTSLEEGTEKTVRKLMQFYPE